MAKNVMFSPSIKIMQQQIVFKLIQTHNSVESL